MTLLILFLSHSSAHRQTVRALKWARNPLIQLTERKQLFTGKPNCSALHHHHQQKANIYEEPLAAPNQIDAWLPKEFTTRDAQARNKTSAIPAKNSCYIRPLEHPDAAPPKAVGAGMRNEHRFLMNELMTE